MELREQHFEPEEEKNETEMTEQQKMLMAFLDLRTTNEKIAYLQKVRAEITPEFLEVAALSMDFVENDGNVEERFSSLIHFLQTREKYEGGSRR